MDKNRYLVPFLALVAIAIIIFAGGAQNAFVLDSEMVVRDNPAVQGGSIFDAIKADWWNAAGPTVEKTIYRPVPQALFAFLHKFSSGAPIYNHVTILLHGLTAFARYLLLLALMRRFTHRALFALVGAGVGLVNGASAEAVVGIVGIAEILASLFSTLSLLAFMGALRTTGSARLLRLAGVGVFYMLALFSKENAVFLPLVLVVLAFVDFGDDAPKEGRATTVLGSLATAAVGGALWMLARKAVLGSVTHFGASTVYFEFTTIERITSSFAVMGSKYLPALFWPFGLTPNITHQDVVPPRGFGDLRVLAGILCWLALGAWGVRSWMRRSPDAILAMLAIVFLVPTSNLFVPIGAVGAYRFLYTPCFAIIAGLAIHCARAMEAGRPARFVSMALLAWAVIVGLFGTSSVVADWKNSSTLFARAIALNPKNTWALQNDTYVNYLENGTLSHEQRLAALRRIDKVLPDLAIVPSTGKVDRPSSFSIYQMLSNRGIFLGEIARDPAMLATTDALFAEALTALTRAEKYALGSVDRIIEARLAGAHVTLGYFSVIVNDKNRPAEDRANLVDDATRLVDSAESLLPQASQNELRSRAAFLRYEVLEARRAAAQILKLPTVDESVINAALDYVLKIDPTNVDALIAASDKASRRGDPATALGHLETLIRAQKGSISVFARAGAISEGQKKLDVAAKYYDAALRMTPHNIDEVNTQKALRERRKGTR